MKSLNSLYSNIYHAIELYVLNVHIFIICNKEHQRMDKNYFPLIFFMLFTEIIKYSLSLQESNLLLKQYHMARKYLFGITALDTERLALMVPSHDLPTLYVVVLYINELFYTF